MTNAPAFGATTGPTPSPETTAGPPSAAAFAAKPAISTFSLSPDNHHLAVAQRANNVETLIVFDLDGNGAPTVAMANHDKSVHIDWIAWKGNNRLVAGVTYLATTYRNKDDTSSQIIAQKYGSFAIAADRDGSHQIELLRSKGYARGSVQLLDDLRGDPDHIELTAPTFLGFPAVWRADVRSGDAVIVERGGEDTLGWETDSTGDVVVRYRQSGRTLIIDGRPSGERGWSLIARIRPKDWQERFSDWDFLAAAGKPGQFYVAVPGRADAPSDTRSVHLYDLATKTLGPALWPEIPYDLNNIVTASPSGALVGVCYWVDNLKCDYKDPVVQANVRGLQRFLGADRNIVFSQWSDDATRMAFYVTAPDDRGSWYLYDWTAHKATFLGESYPDLAAERLGRMQPWSYATRDGAKIAAYLTRPRQAPAGPLPLVVVVHGGPMARDNLDYDIFAQFISTRGYLVFQPNYRGSGGFGQRWLEAGFRQWGGRMQDDIVDGVRALIASGQADPERICVFGASYGGYAALMQGALHPDLYKCVVSWAGIANLNRFVRDDRGDESAPSEVYNYELKEIGNPATESARLARESPVTYAATYGPPVLLIHGGADHRVDPEQSREMHRALVNAGRSSQLVVVPNEGHSYWDEPHETMALDTVGKFLTSHIAPAGR